MKDILYYGSMSYITIEILAKAFRKHRIYGFIDGGRSTYSGNSSMNCRCFSGYRGLGTFYKDWYNLGHQKIRFVGN